VSVQVVLWLDRPLVECGGVVTGTVRWSYNRAHRLLGVRLRFRTQGRGETNTRVVTRADLGSDEAGQASFRLLVPESGPITYDGNLLRVAWQVEWYQAPRRRWLRWREPGPETADVTIVPVGWTRLPPPEPAADA
jgi:hypothetical protein